MTDGSPENPIRVLWAIKGLGHGGAEQLLVSSARVATDPAYAYEVAYIRADKDQLVPALVESHVPSRLLGGGRAGRFSWPLRLRGVMRQYDVVHSHSPLVASVARLGSLTLPRRSRPAVVSTEHNVWGNFSWATRVLNALTCGLDAARWSVSAEVQNSMWGRKGEKAPVLIHGIELDRWVPASDETRARARERLGIPAGGLVTITVANFRREKDYPVLLHAARKVLAADPRITMLAVGQGPLEGDIRRLHESLGLGERFRLLGYRSDTPDLLSAADLFVLSSSTEGLPVSIMEAMAMGLPVVATRAGGVPEAVLDGVTGTLVETGAPDALAGAILGLASDPELRAQFSAASIDLCRRFDIREAVTAQQRAYRRLLEAGGAVGPK